VVRRATDPVRPQRARPVSPGRPVPYRARRRPYAPRGLPIRVAGALRHAARRARREPGSVVPAWGPAARPDFVLRTAPGASAPPPRLSVPCGPRRDPPRALPCQPPCLARQRPPCRLLLLRLLAADLLHEHDRRVLGIVSARLRWLPVGLQNGGS